MTSRIIVQWAIVIPDIFKCNPYTTHKTRGNDEETIDKAVASIAPKFEKIESDAMIA